MYLNLDKAIFNFSSRALSVAEIYVSIERYPYVFLPTLLRKADFFLLLEVLCHDISHFAISSDHENLSKANWRLFLLQIFISLVSAELIEISSKWNRYRQNIWGIVFSRSKISNISVLCFTKPIISVKKCSDNFRFVLVQNAVFGIKNTGLKNPAFIFVLEAVEYKIRGCFCFQTAGIKRIWSVLKHVFEFAVANVATINRKWLRHFTSLGMWHWKMLFGSGLINVTMFSLKYLQLGKFWINGSYLFRSIMVDGKKLFLKVLFLKFVKRILLVFLVL